MGTYYQKNKLLTLEITTTTLCNFACDYCFENGTPIKEVNLVEKRLDEIILTIDKLLKDSWFKENFDKLVISFWGGEPTLKINVIEKIFNYFKDDPRVSYYIYSNGSNINKLMAILNICNQGQFEVQISYDGRLLQDLRRKTKSGKGTADLVLDGIDQLYVNKCDFALKATITWKDFNYLPDMWDDYKNLRDKMGDKIKLSLTVDYHNIQFKKYRRVVEENLILVAKKEIKFYRENGMFLSNIFSGKKGICSAGKNFFIVDNLGKVFTCHGAIYSSDISPLCEIFDYDFISKIKNKSRNFKENENLPKECENCVAVTCLRCNVKKFENSKKDKFFERWNDYLSQPELCNYYKLTGRIGRALSSILREEK